MITKESPYIYLACFPRGGSTMTGELLSEFPHSFIFKELSLANKKGQIKITDEELWPLGSKFYNDRPRGFAGFKNELPMMSNFVRRIGSKEIQHKDWIKYVIEFKYVHTVVIMRDPRDVALSHRTHPGSKNFSNKRIYERIETQYSYMADMIEQGVEMFRYEDLITKPEEVLRLKTHLGLENVNKGMIGQYLSRRSGRKADFKKNGYKLNPSNIERWRNCDNENDKILVRGAKKHLRQIIDKYYS